MIDGKTRFGGIVGKNIGFSLSPLIHNSAARHLGLNAIYLAFDLSNLSPAFFTSMHAAQNCYGFNVTVPYKETAAKFLSNEGTCNTLSRLPDGWRVDSTDGPGFVEGLREVDRKPTDFEQVIILGNGGSAKALYNTLSQINPQLSFKVLRRNPEKDEEWPIDLRLSFHSFQRQTFQELIQQFPKALLLQTTSAPLKGDNLMTFVPGLTAFQGTIVDLVYGRPSALYTACKEKGLPAQDGLPMLLHQALLSQELWWGRSATLDVIREALSSQL